VQLTTSSSFHLGWKVNFVTEFEKVTGVKNEKKRDTKLLKKGAFIILRP
jgi:hypothetical protein